MSFRKPNHPRIALGWIVVVVGACMAGTSALGAAAALLACWIFGAPANGVAAAVVVIALFGGGAFLTGCGLVFAGWQMTNEHKRPF